MSALEYANKKNQTIYVTKLFVVLMFNHLEAFILRIFTLFVSKVLNGIYSKNVYLIMPMQCYVPKCMIDVVANHPLHDCCLLFALDVTVGIGEECSLCNPLN